MRRRAQGQFELEGQEKGPLIFPLPSVITQRMYMYACVCACVCVNRYVCVYVSVYVSMCI